MKKVSNLFIIILFGSLITLSGCAQGQKGVEEVKVKKDIYLQLYSLREDIKVDYTATITKVAEMGYTGIESAGYNDGQFYGMTPSDFKKSIEDVGMEVLSSHTGKRLADNPKNTNWNEIWAWWDTTIQAHKDAGMKYIVTPSMPTPKTLSDLKVYCDYYNQIGEKCNAAGIRFGYHNHAFEFVEIEGQIMYDFMLKNTDPTKVFFQMDVYWSVMGQKAPVDYFNEFPGRFEVLHIKDNKELGQSGMVGFDAIYKNADKAGAKYMIVEVEKYTGTPAEGVKESYDYLANAAFVKNSYK